MSYQSFGFILFIGILVPIYYLLGKKLQPWVLVVANLIFYIIAGIQYLPFILITMLSTFLAGKWIGSIYQKADVMLSECNELAEKKTIKNKAKAKAKKVLLFSLFISVGLLIICKYSTFILSNINSLLSLFKVPEIALFKMILPLGISFYTFMALSYVLDIYWKRYKAENNFLYYAVYLSYFPHVVQGPIDRFNEFRAQIENGVSFSYRNLTFGAQLALWGFFKKLVIADRLGILVNEILGNWTQFDGIFIIVAFAVYSIQIYADFSGCIDIVTGVSEMFGIQLRKNFNHPYFSKTMPEFWRRWHISLQEWFKDYIYYPVSTCNFTKRVKKYFKNKEQKRAEEVFASCFPILVVWAITGIWHGASWNYVAWGMFHATLLIGSIVFAPLFQKLNHLFHIDTNTFGWSLWQMLRTFSLCCIGRVFFRADGLKHAFLLLHKMLTQTSPSVLFDKTISLGLSPENIRFAIVSVLILLIVDMLQEKTQIRETLAKQNIVFRWILIFVALFSVIIFGIYGPEYDASTFIYEQF